MNLSTGIKDFVAETGGSGAAGADYVPGNGVPPDTVEPMILDAEADKAVNTTTFFPHRGRNCHHMIVADPPAGEGITIEYSMDGVTWINIYTGNNNANLLWDTGNQRNTGGGGCLTCPPLLVRVGTTGGTKFTSLHVRTYGSVVR